jgi:hypothetical protein
MIPFPNEEVTPPVTNTYFVADILRFLVTGFKDTNCICKSQGIGWKIFLDLE